MSDFGKGINVPSKDIVYRQDVEDMLRNALPSRGMWEIEGDVVKNTICETVVDLMMDLEKLPSAQPEWNNHTVACLLAELFDDPCACNYNGIDEWLPKKCEVIDSCPNPVGVACWEQYLKHRAERRTDE